MTPHLIFILAQRRRNSLLKWFVEDETGSPDWSRVAIVLCVLAGLVVLKRVMKRVKK